MLFRSRFLLLYLSQLDPLKKPTKQEFKDYVKLQMAKFGEDHYSQFGECEDDYSHLNARAVYLLHKWGYITTEEYMLKSGRSEERRLGKGCRCR